jgi:predicted RNA-binding protein with RPS1 domain/DNA-binding HxlR family transcriptional regulator
MDLERLNKRLKVLAKDPANLTELGRLARDLGHSLPSATPQEMREFRAEAAAVQDDLEDLTSGAELAKGLLFGLIELVAAFEAEIQAVTEREEVRRFIGQEVHLGVVRQLANGPRLPRDLARALATSDAQISRALRDLRALGLVDLFAPAALGDQRTRPHRLTPEGRALSQTLKDETGGRSATRGVASTIIEEPTPVVGQVYEGRVRRVERYGAFVEILPGTEGLVHVSELAPYGVREPADIVKPGDLIPVKVIDIKIQLSCKAVIEESVVVPAPEQERAVEEAATALPAPELWHRNSGGG